MLEQEFEKLYIKFRLLHFQWMFSRVGEREGSLSATEAYSVEVIYLLGNPTVKEFADFIRISQPNASYKVNQLMEKGYLIREKSPTDGREYRLCVTDKFLDYSGANSPYIVDMLRTMRDDFTPREIEQLEGFIKRVTDDMLPRAERIR